MPTHLVGAVLDRAPGPRYFEKLAFAEIAPRSPLPRPAVLARWRASAPEQARVTLHAPPETWKGKSGAFRDDPRGHDGAKWITGAADALRADAIVLVTGRDVSPGPRDRDRLGVWVEHLAARGARKVVWIPGGLWDPEDAQEFAARIGAIPGFDPLEGGPPPGPIVYGRVRAIGARSRLGEGLMGAIADALGEASAETIYLAIEAEDSPRKARRMSDLLAILASEPGGALPRRREETAIDLGDDLDEDEDDEAEEEDEDLDDEDDEDDEDLDDDDDDEDDDEDDDDDDSDDEDE